MGQFTCSWLGRRRPPLPQERPQVARLVAEKGQLQTLESQAGVVSLLNSKLCYWEAHALGSSPVSAIHWLWPCMFTYLFLAVPGLHCCAWSHWDEWLRWGVPASPCSGFSCCFLVAQMVKRLPTMRGTQVWSLGWEDPLEKAMATHSSTLAWKIPWMEEPGRLQSMGLQRVGHDWATSLYLVAECGL